MPAYSRAQTCDCSLYPTYKCITAGNLPDLITSGDLLDYGDAETTPQYIVVTSDINFADPNNTDPYHFAEGSQILMMAGAGLAIRKEVVFAGTNIFGCPTPWNGIDVFGGGVLRLQGSYISNACRAVVLKAFSRAEIVSNAFTANGICVDVQGNAQLLGEGLAHNTFDGVSAPDCSGVGSNPKAIRVTSATYFKIGDQGQVTPPNLITDYTIGLDIYETNLDIFNTRFSGSGSGTGIRLNSDAGVYSANITGLGESVSDPAFLEDYGVGISATNYSLEVKNAFFLNTENQMVYMEKVKFPTALDLSNNRFSGYGFDAVSVSASRFTQANISGNLFIDNNSDVVGERNGIRWSGNQIVPVNEFVKLQNNDFYDNPKTTTETDVYFGARGILANGASRMYVGGNNFYQNYDSPIRHDFDGIYLFNSPGNLFLANDFLGNYGPSIISNTSLRYQGLEMKNSPNNRMICNYAESLNEGFYFDGPACDHTEFRRNDMSDNLTGLYLAPGSIIGEQFEKENEWDGNLPSGGVAEAHFDGNPSLQAKTMSRFSINDSDQDSDYWANPVYPTEDWFVLSNGEIHGHLCYATLPPYPGISTANELTIGGNFEAYKDYDASLWEARLDAYAVLAADPELRPANSPEEAFYDSHESGNIGKLHGARLAWDTIARFTAAFEANWEANETAISDKLGEINEQYQDMEAAETPGAQEIIALTLDTLGNELDTLLAGKSTLCATYKAAVTTRANQLDDDLDEITTTDVWEENLKVVLCLSVARLLSGEAEWTEGQYDTLEAIADQCRHEGGIGVVLARSAIEKYDYDDEEMCPGAEEQQSFSIRAPKIVAIPNPAADYCQVNFGQKISGVARVRNAQGQVFHETIISNIQSLDLPIAQWPGGLYLFDIHPNGENRTSIKLIVTH